eukprot:8964123-Alexandrium_andersonii.AAC.1
MAKSTEAAHRPWQSEGPTTTETTIKFSAPRTGKDNPEAGSRACAQACRCSALRGGLQQQG